MKFDKSKILTVVTADQLKEGQLGWIEDAVDCLKSAIQHITPYNVFRTKEGIVNFPFTAKGRGIQRYFYPAPTYAERQAEWIKENNVKVGTKVRFTKGFEDWADGSDCCEHIDAKGVEGYIKRIVDTFLFVSVPCGGWEVPFTALEVIKEPTYRPYNNDELNDLVGKVLIQKNTGNAMMGIKAVDGEVGKLISLGGSQKRNAQQLLDGWTHKNGEPCGVKEEV